MTTPPSRHPLTPERPPAWLALNRPALLALLPLLLLTGLTASFRYVTLYRPNEFTQPQTTTGQSLNFHETFSYTGYSGVPEQYDRNVTITLKSLTSAATFEERKAVQGSAFWVVELQFQAAPDVPLEGCHVFIVDNQGTLYNDQAGQPGLNLVSRLPCVPVETPGPTLDFMGKLERSGPPRPESWTFRRAVALPEGQQPRFVRVAWNPPQYAQLTVKDFP